MAEWYESWDRYDVAIEALVEVGDRIVLFQHHVGRAKGSGIELDQRGALLVQLRGGKVVLHRPYTHRADALEGAGSPTGRAGAPRSRRSWLDTRPGTAATSSG